MKKFIINVLRWGIPAAILGYLFYYLHQGGGLANFRVDPRSWHWLALSLVLVTTATVVGILRWYLLIHALDIRFSFISAVRLGLLGELFNFVLFGSVGGDLVKATLLARDQPGRRTKAVSTVLVDRVIGFYSLFLLASIAILLTGTMRTASQNVQVICLATLSFTVVATVGLVALVSTRKLSVWLASRLSKLPYVGAVFDEVAQALGQYRRRWPVLVAAVGISIAVHLVLAVSVFCIALALPGDAPSLGQHMVIIPLATTTGVLPFLPGGLGAFELVVEELYLHLSPAAAVTKGQGVAVALGYRVISLVMAAIGAGVYFATQREVGTVIRQLATSKEKI